MTALVTDRNLKYAKTDARKIALFPYFVIFCVFYHTPLQIE